MSRLFTATQLISPLLLSSLIHPPKSEIDQTNSAIQLKRALTTLGPAYIKLGQQLSIRPDLLPAPYLIQLASLLDSCPPFDDELGLTLICESLGNQSLESIFVINNPEDIHADIKRVASASLGQVYKAKLKATNEDVAIKGKWLQNLWPSIVEHTFRFMIEAEY